MFIVKKESSPPKQKEMEDMVRYGRYGPFWRALWDLRSKMAEAEKDTYVVEQT